MSSLAVSACPDALLSEPHLSATVKHILCYEEDCLVLWSGTSSADGSVRVKSKDINQQQCQVAESLAPLPALCLPTSRLFSGLPNPLQDAVEGWGLKLKPLEADCHPALHFSFATPKSLACVDLGSDPCYKLLDGAQGVSDQLPKADVSQQGG